jgi:hypothetical protein
MQADPTPTAPTPKSGSTNLPPSAGTGSNSASLKTESADQNLSTQTNIPTSGSATGPSATPSIGESANIPSPTNFGFTTNQALMTVVTLLGAVLIVHSLRRMNSKPKAPAKPKPTGDFNELTALRNEIYAKYPPPPRQPRPAAKTPDPQLRLVDDRVANPPNPAEINALRQQIEQLSHEVAHLQSRVKDLEYSSRREPAPVAAPPNFSVTRESPAPSASTPIDHQNIYRLADRGMNAVEIAKTLGQHTGQVELILNLRRATGS